MNSPTSTTLDVVPARRPSLFRGVLFRALGELPQGRLRLELPDSAEQVFGQADAVAGPDAVIRVRRERFFRRCVLEGDIGFAEAYLDGDWETPDLTAVIGWFIHNLEHAPTLSGSRRRHSPGLNLLRWGNRIGHLLRPNSRRQARRNISEHYDLSNDFFTLMLDPTMMYSSALWRDPAHSLEEAQVEKNDSLCRKLRLQPTDRVLEIGTGWGGWSLHAASRYGCRVTTLTISRQQYELAQKRVRDAGLEGRVDVQLCDYRDITGQFDRIVSIEMLEAVGHRYLPSFCQAVSRLLRPNGLLALQFITCPDSRYEQLRRGVDFIQKHIFPGSLLLSLNRMNEQLTRAGGFVMNALEDFGPDYARTLRIWRDNFSARLDAVRGLGFDDRFIRKWTYYLCYCEAAFALRNISVVQTLHTRPNNPSF